MPQERLRGFPVSLSNLSRRDRVRVILTHKFGVTIVNRDLINSSLAVSVFLPSQCVTMNRSIQRSTSLSWCKFAKLQRWALMSSWWDETTLSARFFLTHSQLEYDNTEGMILLSELSRRRIRSVQKLIRVGRNEVVVVLRVDKEKGSCRFVTISSA